MIDTAVTQTLDLLHQQARRDWRHIPSVLPQVLLRRLSGRSLMKSVTPAMLKRMYIPVSRQDGRMLYSLARGVGARRIVEFGASFGVSTLYLAAAARENGGLVVTTEIEPSKCEALRANLTRAGLDDVAEVLEGDALQTLHQVAGPVDLVFLDGWKDLYLPVLELLMPKMRSGAVVIADNVNLADTQPYLKRVRSDADFVTALLPGNRLECSWYLPRETPHVS